MKSPAIFLIALFLMLISCCGVLAKEALPERARRDKDLIEIFNASFRRDTSSLEEYGKTNKQELQYDHILNVGYRLALYGIDPVKNADRFVEAFPTDSKSIMDIFLILETQGKPFPPFSPYCVLREIALTGNREAIRKSLIAAARSDAAAAEGLNDFAEDVISKYPQISIEEMVSLPLKERKIFYSLFLKNNARGGPSRKDLLEMKKAVSEKAHVVIDEILFHHQQNPQAPQQQTR